MSKSNKMTTSRFVARRLGAALAIILFAFILTYVTAWWARGLIIMGRGYNIPLKLQNVGKELAKYTQNNDRYPLSLKEQVEWATNEKSYRVANEDGQLWFADPWGNDFQYQSDGKNYRLYSRHPDGEIGGYELTGNLDNNLKGRVRAEPSLNEFLYKSKHHAALFYANLTASLFASVLCFFILPRLGERRCSLLVIVSFIATMTIFVIAFTFFCIMVCVILE